VVEFVDFGDGKATVGDLIYLPSSLLLSPPQKHGRREGFLISAQFYQLFSVLLKS
jgi:hypothetical protein